MIVISHRGNFSERNVATENTVGQISKMISRNIPVEIDLRYFNNDWYLGHDTMDNKVDINFLLDNKEMLWCHAKNIDALEKMLELGLHCFWHQTDAYTLTSNKIIWAYPNYYTGTGILVMPDDNFIDNLTLPIYGICVDNPAKYI